MFTVAEKDEESSRVDLACVFKDWWALCAQVLLDTLLAASLSCCSQLLLSCTQYDKSRVCKSKLSHLLFIVPWKGLHVGKQFILLVACVNWSVTEVITAVYCFSWVAFSLHYPGRMNLNRSSGKRSKYLFETPIQCALERETRLELQLCFFSICVTLAKLIYQTQLSHL